MQEEISQLKARISELVSKKFSIENTNMASSIHRDIPTILQNMDNRGSVPNGSVQIRFGSNLIRFEIYKIRSNSIRNRIGSD